MEESVLFRNLCIERGCVLLRRCLPDLEIVWPLQQSKVCDLIDLLTLSDSDRC
jgi:hypothetical protein